MECNGQATDTHSIGKPPWSVIFLFAIWITWKSRNNFAFKGKSPNLALARDIKKQAVEYFFYAYSSKSVARLTLRPIKWEKPQSGWIEMNTDGSSNESSRIAGCGGVLRDEQGRWIKGFAKKIGIINSFITEMWGLRDGLLMCCSYNVSCVEIELDAKAIIDVLLNSNYVDNIVSPILDDCRQLISNFSQVWIRHCYREANRCANKLAKMGSSHIIDFATFDNPPSDVLAVYKEGLNGVYVNRLYPESELLV